jgi:hypothetical protein
MEAEGRPPFQLITRDAAGLKYFFYLNSHDTY